MAENKLMTSLLWSAFCYFIMSFIIKMKFLESWDKLNKVGMFFETKIMLNLPQFGLTLTFAQMKSENECHHRILRSSWPKRHPYNIPIQLVWPDLALYLVKDTYLYSSLLFPREAFWQSTYCFAVIISHVSVTHRAKRTILTSSLTLA